MRMLTSDRYELPLRSIHVLEKEEEEEEGRKLPPVHQPHTGPRTI